MALGEGLASGLEAIQVPISEPGGHASPTRELSSFRNRLIEFLDSNISAAAPQDHFGPATVHHTSELPFLNLAFGRQWEVTRNPACGGVRIEVERRLFRGLERDLSTGCGQGYFTWNRRIHDQANCAAGG